MRQQAAIRSFRKASTQATELYAAFRQKKLLVTAARGFMVLRKLHQLCGGMYCSNHARARASTSRRCCGELKR